MHWYALDVVRQKEYLAGRILQRRMGCATFIPTETRWRKPNRFAKSKREVAFAALPGTIFAGFPGGPDWLKLFDVPLVTGVLSIGDRPMRIRTDDKDWVRYRGSQLDGYLVVERVKGTYKGEAVWRSQSGIHVQGRGVLRAPKEQQHMRTKKEFAVGDEVMVTDGPLRFNAGKVKRIDGVRATVLMPLFGGVETSIPLDGLEAA